MCSTCICVPTEPELEDLARQAGLYYGWIFDFVNICRHATPATWDF